MKKWFFAVVGIALLAAGCGGNTGTTSNTSSPNTPSGIQTLKPEPNQVDAAFEGFESELDREYNSSMDDVEIIGEITNTSEASVQLEEGIQ